MLQEPVFHPIDFSSWPRREIFYYFAKMAPTGYSITAEVDITACRRELKERGIRFFPAYLWAVTTCLNRQPEFKTAEKEGVLGYYETLTPLYAAFHEDDHTFSLMWTEYRENFPDFYGAYLENQRLHGERHGCLSQPDTPPPANAYTVSCVPWVDFSHFAVHSYENKPYYFPSVEAGKFREQEGRTLLPLSLTCHHAATDGWHIKEFLADLQHLLDHWEEWIS